MANNSDYDKRFTDLFELLPEVYKSDVNKSIFANLFNRFLTKPELTHKDGFVGVGNPNSQIDRQLKEPTPNRQAYQLQPMMYEKIGTIEHMATWENILAELERLGVDLDRNKLWGNTQKFNWVPPIDIDKLLHFRDYYWYNPDQPADLPQYLTIKNLCTVADAKVTLYQKVLTEKGEDHIIINLNAGNQEISINGDLSDIFVEDFVFFTKNSLNPEFDNVFWTTDSSVFDLALNRTIITVKQTFTNDSIINGIVSLSELLGVFEAERDCVCTGSVGWDGAGWDDNQLGSVLWNTDMMTAISHPTLAAWVDAGNNPTRNFPIIADRYDVWYDTTTDSLKQYIGDLTPEIIDFPGAPYRDPSNWIEVQGAFSAVVALTTGEHFWDFSEGCGFPQNQWVDQNKWLHKSVVPNFSIAKQAEVPIIEFSPFLELNEWVDIDYNFKYRETKFDTYEDSEIKPPLFELIELNTYDISSSTTLEMNSKYGNLTETFIPDYTFNIINSVASLYTVIDVIPGLGGSFIVSGDATNDYISQSAASNPDNLPSMFKIRNSFGNLLDGDWTVEVIKYFSFIIPHPIYGADVTVITIPTTESITTITFAGAEVYTTNNGTYTVDHSLFKRVETSFPITNISVVPVGFVVTGDFETDSNFTNSFRVKDNGINNGVWTVVNATYDPILNTTLIETQEAIPNLVPSGFVFVDKFKTVIEVQELFNSKDGSNDGIEIPNQSDGSNLTPVETSQGDIWRGYNIHWLYDSIKIVNPINHQRLNPDVDLLNQPIQLSSSLYGYNPYNNYTSGDFEFKTNYYAQQFNLKVIGGLYKFELHPSLQQIVKKGDDNIRVYIKTELDNQRIRQYGTFDELTQLDMGVVAGDDKFVAAIEFNPLTPVPRYAQLTIEINPATLCDIGFENILVRTEEDNTIFDLDPLAGSEELSLVEFKKFEQVKIDRNQYPLFDMYSASGIPNKTVSRIFGFKESPDAPINFAVNRRIVVDEPEYEFEQFLVETDNGKLLAYRDYSLPHGDYFVDKTDNSIFEWTGLGWDNRSLTDIHYLDPIVSDIPIDPPFDTIPGQLWFNPKTQELKIYNGITMLFEDVVFDFVDLDPGLKTVWQPGLNDEEYVPEYVDGDRNPVPIGDVTGDWELPDPLYYNVHHENRKCVKMSELITHFNTIINEQDPEPGFFGTGAQLFHINLNPNYGLGGTIREYNESFDTLLSSTFVNNVTPIRLIEYAHDQYEIALNTLIEVFIRDSSILLSDVSAEAIVNFNTVINDYVIAEHEQNDINDIIFGDSPTFNEDTDQGIRNWVATLPFFKLAHKFKPEYVIDERLKINQIIHHDGHRSNIKIQDSVKENIIRKLLITPETRANVGDFLGNAKNQFTTTRPQTSTDFLTLYSALNVASGKYWFETIGGQRILYRFNVVSAGTVPPADTWPDGTYWFDTLTDTLRIKAGPSTWNPVTVVGDGILADAWEIIDLNETAALIILEAEERLYSVIPDFVDLVFDFDQLNIDEPSVYHKNSEIAFAEFIKELEIESPFSQQGVFQQNNPLTWNYVNSVATVLPYTGAPATLGLAGTWQDLYEKMYGTPYPHLEPWKLQGYQDKPDWWDATYRETDGSRRWIYDHGTITGMWENIRIGLVPLGEVLPNTNFSTGIPGEVTTYSFMSVMIDDVPQDGFNPDDLLPPFYDHRPTFGGAYIGPIRSLFFDFGLHIIQPNLDFVFDDSGFEEWKWLKSSQRLYDELSIAFKMQPMRFIHSTFGITFVQICDLQVDKDTSKVYSHKDTLFHGDIDVDEQLFTINGLNQWYTNFNRSSGFDISASDFRRLWINWDSPLTYQFASFIDSSTFVISNKNFDITEKDFNLALKRSPGISDTWLDSLKIKLLKAPPLKALFDTEGQWKFEIDTSSPIARRSCYYDVKNYPFHIDLNTNIGTLYKFPITTVDPVNNIFTIAGDWRHVFSTLFNCEVTEDIVQFEISDSTGNDGTWSISSIAYDSILDVTNLKALEAIIDFTDDGNIVADYRNFDWETGQEIRLESTGRLPKPFEADFNYYIIRVSATEFQIAENKPDALDNIPIIFDDIGSGQVYIGEITSTFKALNGAATSHIWKNYALDKTMVRAFIPPLATTGVQNTLNVIDGYSEFTKDENWVYNFESIEAHHTLGRVVGWQLEKEIFVDSSYTAQHSQFGVTDSYDITADDSTDIFSFIQFTPNWGTGTKVVVTSTEDLPDPLIKLIPYYIIRNVDEPFEFQLALTRNNAINGNAIDLSTSGTGNLIIQEHVEKTFFPVFEINPFKNNIWYNNDQGIIANLLTGPFPDIRTEQTIYDQYGRLIDTNNVTILRQDKISKIFVKPEIPNDVTLPKPGQEDPNNFLHIGGAHLFIDGYEHVVIWENYSSEGFLIYDPFVGLNTPKFDLIFDSQIEFTLRPNVGGTFLFEEQELIKNIEATTKDLELAYDTYDTSEASTMTELSRKTLGYLGEKEYLNQININAKSQFIFWRGMIQAKGSVNAAKAFINSRRFVDAKIDEYWAYKISEYGDARERSYPEIKLLIDDSLSNELKFEFVEIGEDPEKDFKPITITDEERWFEFPVQQNHLNSLGNEFYFNAEITSKDEAPIFPPAGGEFFYKSETAFDSVIITHVVPVASPPNIIDTVFELIEGTDYEIVNSKLIRFLISGTLPAGDPNILDQVKIYTENPAKTKHNPSKMIDYKSGVVITNVPIWDPARGHHYHITNHLIDLSRDTDAAEYTHALIDQSPIITDPDTGAILEPWNKMQVGTVWLDTSKLGYTPYHDPKINDTVIDRIRNWGQIADWGEAKLYQWTESDVHPNDWNDIAIVEEGDKTLDDSVKKTGRVKEEVFNVTTSLYEVNQVLHNEYRVIDTTDSFLVEPGPVTITQTDPAEITAYIQSRYNTKIYVNEEEVETILTFNTTSVPAGTDVDTITYTIDPSVVSTLTDKDCVRVILFAYDAFDDAGVRIAPTQEEIDNGDFIIEVPHTQIVTINQDFTDNITYYFWVTDKTTKINDNLSLKEIKEQMVNIPIPYMILQKFQKGIEKVFPEVSLPDRYVQYIVRGLAGKVDENERYKMRFTRDFILRDDYEDGKSSIDLKNSHEEWTLFRERQPFHINRELWDYATEALMGESLDGSVRVPSLEKELFDDLHQTTTRYGIQPGQTFVDSDLGIATVVADLFNPDNDFTPIDINSFVQTHNFDTPEDVRITMETIFNTFASEHVNRIFFDLLHDSLSLKTDRYEDIFKTSMISLHGIRILERAGLFDD